MEEEHGWIISRASSGGDNCVAVNIGAATVVVRHSKHPDGLHVSFSGREWSALLTALRSAGNGPWPSDADSDWFVLGDNHAGAAVRFLDGSVGLRHSGDPECRYLSFTPSEWAAFRAGVQNGEFDPPQSGSPLGVDCRLANGAARVVSHHVGVRSQ